MRISESGQELQSQFLNHSQLANHVLKMTWKHLKCGLCNNLAQNPRLCQKCEAVACYSCITDFQQEIARDPSVCFKGCRFVLFFPLHKRERELSSLFQSILKVTQIQQSSEDQLNSYAKQIEPKEERQISDAGNSQCLIQKGSSNSKDSSQEMQKSDGLNLNPENQIQPLTTLGQNTPKTQKDRDKFLDGFIQQGNEPLDKIFQTCSENEVKSASLLTQLCLLCKLEVSPNQTVSHLELCRSNYRFCSKCKCFKSRKDLTHLCFILQNEITDAAASLPDTLMNDESSQNQSNQSSATSSKDRNKELARKISDSKL